MQTITTIFWDLDGTLVNTHNLYDQAIEFACQELSYPILYPIANIPNGQTLQQDFMGVTGIANCIDAKDIAILNSLCSLAIGYLETHFSENLMITPSIKLFNYFYSLGLKQSIVSNCPQVVCNFIINKIGLRDKCSNILGIETVAHGKPNPDLYLYALQIHKVNHLECLVFEDSITGISAAQKAKLAVVGIGSPQSIQVDFSWDMRQEDELMLACKLAKQFKFTAS